MHTIRIKSIKRIGFDDTYDLKVHPNRNFYLANGILNHNSGKSKFGDILGSYASTCLKTKYGIDNICMTPEEFKKRIENADKNDVVIYDEAHRGMGSRRSLSEINNILVDLMMEMGQKNLFVIIILPTFFMLDKYPALYRARGLFHVYERKHKRGFWVYFNERDKLKLYRLGKKEFNYNCMHYPKFRGRFYNQYAVDKDEYIKKKAKSFENRIRVTRAETFKHDRDLLLYIIYKKWVNSSREISKILKEYHKSLNDRTIREILAEFEQNLTKIKDKVKEYGDEVLDTDGEDDGNDG